MGQVAFWAIVSQPPLPYHSRTVSSTKTVLRFVALLAFLWFAAGTAIAVWWWFKQRECSTNPNCITIHAGVVAPSAGWSAVLTLTVTLALGAYLVRSSRRRARVGRP